MPVRLADGRGDLEADGDEAEGGERKLREDSGERAERRGEEEEAAGAEGGEEEETWRKEEGGSGESFASFASDAALISA